MTLSDHVFSSSPQGGGKFIPELDDINNDKGNPSHFSPSPDAISLHSDITTSSRSVDYDTLSLHSAEIPLAFEDGGLCMHVCVCACVCDCVCVTVYSVPGYAQSPCIHLET